MKLSEYIDHLLKIEKEFGGDLDIVYSSDDEGNCFDYVHYSPSAGVFEDSEFAVADIHPNSVCVN